MTDSTQPANTEPVSPNKPEPTVNTAPVVPPPTPSFDTPPSPEDTFTVTTTPPPSKSGNKKILGALLVLLVLFVGLGALLLGVQDNQDIRQRAQVYPEECEVQGGECVPDNYICTGGLPSQVSCGDPAYKCYRGGSCIPPASPRPNPSVNPTSCAAADGECVPDNWDCTNGQPSNISCDNANYKCYIGGICNPPPSASNCGPFAPWGSCTPADPNNQNDQCEFTNFQCINDSDHDTRGYKRWICHYKPDTDTWYWFPDSSAGQCPNQCPWQVLDTGPDANKCCPQAPDTCPCAGELNCIPDPFVAECVPWIDQTCTNKNYWQYQYNVLSCQGFPSPNTQCNVPSPSPLTCGSTCNYPTDCESIGMTCFEGQCRNPQCTGETDCTCNQPPPSPTPPPPSPTPPPPSPLAQCVNLKIYQVTGDINSASSWQLLTNAQLTALTPGDIVYAATLGSLSNGATVTRARIRINSTTWTPSNETTSKKPKVVTTEPDEYYIAYSIPQGTTNFTFESEVYSPQFDDNGNPSDSNKGWR